MLLGVSEGRDSSLWHWERGSPAWHPSSSLPQLQLPLGHSLGMNTGEFLSLLQCSHRCPHPLSGRMQLAGSQNQPPPCPYGAQILPRHCCPLLWHSQATCLAALCHPSQLLLPDRLADLPLLPRRLGCSWGAWLSCCYPQHCLLKWGPSCHSPPCRWPPGCSRKSCCGAGTG